MLCCIHHIFAEQLEQMFEEKQKSPLPLALLTDFLNFNSTYFDSSRWSYFEGRVINTYIDQMTENAGK